MSIIAHAVIWTCVVIHPSCSLQPRAQGQRKVLLQAETVRPKEGRGFSPTDV